MAKRGIRSGRGRALGVAVGLVSGLVLATPGVSAAAAWRPAGSGLPTNASVLTLAVDPGDSSTVYAGLLREGIYRARGGALRWHSVTNFPILAGEKIMTFPVGIVSLATDPIRPGTVYAGTSFAGLLSTEEAGLSWGPSNAGLEGRSAGELGLLFSVDALAVHPAEHGAVYAGIRGRGVFRSGSHGADWKATGPLEHGDIRALAVHPARPGVVYVGTLGGGVYKSVDAGNAWRLASHGLGNRLVRAITVHPTRPWVVYAGTFGGIYKSVDGGRHWSPASNGLGSQLVQDVLVHPTRPRTVYAATRGAGVFESVDGGAHWRPINRGLANRLVMALAMSSSRPGVLYAGTLGGLFVRTGA